MLFRAVASLKSPMQKARPIFLYPIFWHSSMVSCILHLTGYQIVNPDLQLSTSDTAFNDCRKLIRTFSSRFAASSEAHLRSAGLHRRQYGDLAVQQLQNTFTERLRL